ncbi:MAG: aldo/keto reductase [Phycisphaerae bacterium]|nr:aldo/keto reductase [Phycisphaerae bacterium]
MMIYRQLGSTGLRVSQLGFGAMRLPMTGPEPDARVDRELAVPMLRRAMELGVNYIDSAVGYCNGDSQRAVGDAIKGWPREQLVISTKNPCYGLDEKEWWTHLENSLERLGVSYIDMYNHHGMGWQGYTEHVLPRVSTWMRKAKDQGLVRHIANSFHDNAAALKKLVDTGYTSSITLRYNMLDRTLEGGIAYAREKGVGIVVMGPVGGGRLGATSAVLEQLIPGVRRVPELALRFALSNPGVCVALSGMSTMQQVEENCATASGDVTLSAADNAAIQERIAPLKHLAEQFCTGCAYCVPCPAGVNIPNIFDKYNWARAYGLWDTAREGYEQISVVPWEPGKRADACTGCGICETKCPQKLPIRDQLKEAHAALAKT